MKLRPIALVVALASLGSLAACHRHRDADDAYEAISMLQSPEWKERRKAADELRNDDGVPPQAIPVLYGAIMREQNPKAYGAMLITLGASGIAEVRPMIDARINDPDEDMQRWARTALKKWLVRNGLWGDDQDLPPPPRPVYGPPAALPPGAPASHPTPGLAGPVPAAPPGVAPPATTPPQPPPSHGTSI